MPDLYATIAQADETLQARLADVLEVRAADPQQRAMLDGYLSEIELPSAAAVLDVGCGTGAVTRALAAMRGAGEVIGLDPSPIFIEKARELGKGLPQASFCTGDGRAVPFPDASFDLVVFTLPCAISRIRRRHCSRPIACFDPTDGSPCSTAIT